MTTLDSIRINFPSHNLSLGISRKKVSKEVQKRYSEFWNKQIQIDPEDTEYLLAFSTMRFCFENFSKDDIHWSDKIVSIWTDPRLQAFCEAHGIYSISSSKVLSFISEEMSLTELPKLPLGDRVFLLEKDLPLDPIPLERK